MSNATNRVLDRLADLDKEAGGTGTDYAIAKRLDVSTQQVSKWRREVDQMGDGMAIRAAELLGVHPMIVIGEIRTERGRDEREKKFWAATARAAKSGKVAAVILAAGLAPALSETAAGLCILCQIDQRPNWHRFKRREASPARYTPGRIRTLQLAA